MVSRPDGWRALVRGSAEDRAAALGDLDRTLAALAEVIPGATACSITELDADEYRTTASSSTLASALDQVQYADGDGPCMAAARGRVRQQVPDTAAVKRFDAYAAAAARRGIRSSLSIPITVVDRPGSLNIYSRRLGGFDARSCAVADLAARVLSVSLADASPADVSSPAAMSAAETALVADRRELMRAAQAPALAAGVSQHDAFITLVRRSSVEQRSIFDVARDIVGGTAGSA